MQNFKEYMVSALQEAGLSDEQVSSALDKIAANDKLSPKLNALVKTATEDYNAQLGRVRAAEEKVTKYDDWYTKASAQYQAVVDELNALKAAAANGGAPPDFDASKYVSKEDLAKFSQEMGGRLAGVVKDVSEVTADYVARFGEKPSLNEIEKIAEEKRIPIPMAYQEYIRPKVEERAKLALEEEKKKMREEIERDVRSKFRLPVDQVVPEAAPIFAPRPTDTPQDLNAELMDVWVGATKK